MADKALAASGAVLTRDSMNKRLIKAQYAVRGELAIRAEELRRRLAAQKTAPASDEPLLPFEQIIACNIGNPQQLRQLPISFFRQVLALVECPQLMSIVAAQWPTDVIERAKAILEEIGSSGAYSHSQGISMVRKAVARFIERRDGGGPDAAVAEDCIFMTNGASDGVHRILSCIISGENVGIMIPIPQYPLYTASITLYNGKSVPYYMAEDGEWSLSMGELARALEEARAEGVDVRALVLINPGNPTGNCLSEGLLREIVSFCSDNHLLLIADEVYQANVYGSHSFVSARSAAIAVERETGKRTEVISFHSTSKGLIGECGHRGGYFECYNIDAFVRTQLYKLASICLCANVPGQILMMLTVDGPQSGDASFEAYSRELDAIYGSLARRALAMQQALSKMEGVTCNEAAGAMYLFPRIDFPPAFLEKVTSDTGSCGRSPDTVYALDLLDSTGICIVPGSGFGQRPGTFHIRTTFLPDEQLLVDLIQRWSLFHANFMAKYRRAAATPPGHS